MDCSPPGSSPWDSPGKNTGVGYHSLLQGFFPTQGSNLDLLHWQVDSLPLAKQGSKKQFYIRVESPAPPLPCVSLHHSWRANHNHSLQVCVYHPHHSVTLTSLLSPAPWTPPGTWNAPFPFTGSLLFLAAPPPVTPCLLSEQSNVITFSRKRPSPPLTWSGPALPILRAPDTSLGTSVLHLFVWFSY